MAPTSSPAPTSVAPVLNVYRKVAVIRLPSDTLTYEDAEGNQKSISVKELGDAIASAVSTWYLASSQPLEQETHTVLGLLGWRHERRMNASESLYRLLQLNCICGLIFSPTRLTFCCFSAASNSGSRRQTPLHAPKLKLDIPVPRINAVQGYEQDVPANFKIPLSFTRFTRPSNEEWNDTLDYIADVEDEAWLHQNVKFGSSMKLIENDRADDLMMLPTANLGYTQSSTRRPQLSLRLFELMFDQLEKATAFEFIISVQQADTLFKAKIPQLYHVFPAKARQNSVTIKQVIQEVYDYWVQKRSKLKRPLLRRYWPVTSSDDTNPHLVFRPREKEKYKLRKKRQNDTNAYRKMKQLREDFDNLRAVLDLLRSREEVHRTYVQLQVEHFQQRLYDIVDTSGQERQSLDIRKREWLQTLEVPTYFDGSGRKVKRTRTMGPNGFSSMQAGNHATNKEKARIVSAQVTGENTSNIAGRNNGEPAPNFLQPLPTREGYVTSWEGAVPYIPTYEDSQAHRTYRYRQRPRVGRGGRLCIDRLPQALPPENHSTLAPITVFTAGFSMLHSLEPKERLLDLLPQPLNYATTSEKIESITISGIKEDLDALKGDSLIGVETDDNDGDEVIVKLEDWLETDDQLWGEERYVVGPI